jgi:hypothetical protein
MKAQEALSPRKREEVREYFEQTLYSRLDDKRRGRIISIQQRLHEDDFAGYLIDKGSFDHLNLPAIAEIEQRLPLYQGRVYRRRIGDLLSPEREPPETLDTIREQIGSYAFSAQYLWCRAGTPRSKTGPIATSRSAPPGAGATAGIFSTSSAAASTFRP